MDTSCRSLRASRPARRPAGIATHRLPHAFVTLGHDLLRMVREGPASPDDRAFSSARRTWRRPDRGGGPARASIGMRRRPPEAGRKTRALGNYERIILEY